MSGNICVFGDSIAFGKYDSKGGWVARLAEFLEARYLAKKGDEFYVYNLSISGNHTGDVLARFETELKPRFSEKREWIVVFAVGLNDSVVVHSKNDHWVGIGEFQKNIRKLICLANEFSDKIIFVGPTSPDYQIVDPMPWDLDKSYREAEVKKYDAALRDICQKSGARYLPLYDKFAAGDYKKLLYDGAHPNSAGHQLIFETVRDYLLEQKII